MLRAQGLAKTAGSLRSRSLSEERIEDLAFVQVWRRKMGSEPPNYKLLKNITGYTAANPDERIFKC